MDYPRSHFLQKIILKYTDFLLDSKFGKVLKDFLHFLKYEPGNLTPCVVCHYVLVVTSPQGLSPMASSQLRINPFPRCCNSSKLLNVKFGGVETLSFSGVFRIQATVWKVTQGQPHLCSNKMKEEEEGGEDGAGRRKKQSGGGQRWGREEGGDREKEEKTICAKVHHKPGVLETLHL